MKEFGISTTYHIQRCTNTQKDGIVTLQCLWKQMIGKIHKGHQGVKMDSKSKSY